MEFVSLSESKSIFDDRRNRLERRRQNLSIPAGLDRRKLARRHRRFSARSWWLDTEYAVELISEKTVTQENPAIADSNYPNQTPVRPEKNGS